MGVWVLEIAIVGIQTPEWYKIDHYIFTQYLVEQYCPTFYAIGRQRNYS